MTHPERRPQLLGAVAGLLSAVLFGASVPITKQLLPDVAPTLLAGLLYLGGGLAVGSVRLVARQRIVEASLGRADLPRVLAIVLLGGVLGPLALVNGLRTVSGVSGALLLNLEGPLTVLVAITVFGEHLGPRAGARRRASSSSAHACSQSPARARARHASPVSSSSLTACAAWAVDNNLTQGLAGKDPWQLVIAKTLGAGTGMVIARAGPRRRAPRTAGAPRRPRARSARLRRERAARRLRPPAARCRA